MLRDNSQSWLECLRAKLKDCPGGRIIGAVGRVLKRMADEQRRKSLQLSRLTFNKHLTNSKQFFTCLHIYIYFR